MKIGDRVKHEEFGYGTVKHIMCEGTVREMYLIDFDASNSEFHDGFGIIRDKHGWWCKESELVKVDEKA